MRYPPTSSKFPLGIKFPFCMEASPLDKTPAISEQTTTSNFDNRLIDQMISIKIFITGLFLIMVKLHIKFFFFEIMTKRLFAASPLISICFFFTDLLLMYEVITIPNIGE